MNQHHVSEYLGQGPRHGGSNNIYQLLLDFLFTRHVLVVTSVVTESTGWWLNSGSLQPYCLGLHPGSVPSQLRHLRQVV